MGSSDCVWIITVGIILCLKTRVCGFCWTQQNASLSDKKKTLSFSSFLCLSVWLWRQMFLLSSWIPFHCFHPSLFLGLANRTQGPPGDKWDSRVIVTLAPGPDMSASLKDLLRFRRKEFNRWTCLFLVMLLSFLCDLRFNPKIICWVFFYFKCLWHLKQFNLTKVASLCFTHHSLFTGVGECYWLKHRSAARGRHSCC